MRLSEGRQLKMEQGSGKLTLNEIRKSPKLGRKKVFQASDFLSKEEQLELKRANFEGRKKRKIFGEIDAFEAEMISRFGYSFFKDWKAGVIKAEQVNKFIAAERARDKASSLALEAIIMAMVGSCVQRAKGQPAPRGLKMAQKIFKNEEKTAKGEF